MNLERSPFRKLTHQADLCVVGGGMTGVCLEDLWRNRQRSCQYWDLAPCNVHYANGCVSLVMERSDPGTHHCRRLRLGRSGRSLPAGRPDCMRMVSGRERPHGTRELDLDGLSGNAGPSSAPQGKGGWLEPNPVIAPNGELMLLVRVDSADGELGAVQVDYRRNRIEAWVNGQKAGEAAEVQFALDHYQRELPGAFDVVGWSHNRQAPFVGRLDDLRFFRRPLTADEIRGADER